MTEILSQTESVCPECLMRIPAMRVQHGADVFLEKTCPQHGYFSTLIWRGEPELSSWVRPKTPSYPQDPTTEIKDGCPFDCGLCSDHRQHTCSVLMEVTQRCDLHCPVCFADSGGNHVPDWSLEEIAAWYKRLLATGGPFNIQLSGGEPCMRDDLAEIIQLGRSFGFTFFQLNTNGLRLARDVDYLKKLKAAGLSSVFLQFDSTRDAVYQQLRGRELFAQKMAVIEHCADVGVGVVLVPTLVRGVNTQDIGDIIRLGLEHMPTVRGVHFQPISHFGRYPGNPEEHFTIPEILQTIENQTQGQICFTNFNPPGCENAVCSFHGNFVYMPDGSLKALNHHNNNACCCKPIEAARGAAQSRKFVAENWSMPRDKTNLSIITESGFGEWDVFLGRKRTHTFCLSGMAFMDAWTMDLERLRDCCIHVASPDGRLVPFCAYNLTDRQGRSLYRNNYAPHSA